MTKMAGGTPEKAWFSKSGVFVTLKSDFFGIVGHCFMAGFASPIDPQILHALTSPRKMDIQISRIYRLWANGVVRKWGRTDLTGF